MNVLTENSNSIWMDVKVAPEATPLTADTGADVVVVGSGIAGLSTAYELVLAGYSVVVLDRGVIAGGMTARTTAHLASVCDDGLSDLLSMRGRDLVRGFHTSQTAAIDRIQQIQERLKIDCNFRRLPAFLFLDASSDESVLDDEVAAAAEIGVAVERGVGLPLRGLGGHPCLTYPRQATFHPLKYLRGLAEALVSDGCRLHPFSAVTAVEEVGDEVRVKVAGGHAVTARHAVVATNSPIHDLVAIHTKQAPYRTYAMGFEIAPGRLADALYWDTADPYHYVRLDSGHTEGNEADILIVGGEDHKSGEADDAPDRFDRLDRWIRALLPDLGPERFRWSGQVMETLDYCGYIGADGGSSRVFVATGDSGQGMTHGVVASLVIADLIAGRSSPFADVYDPDRKPVKAATTYISENLTAVTNMAQYLAPGEVSSVDELEPGQGAIVRDGLKKIAAYRAPDGTLFERSAVCTHLGCHLAWNSFELCWDCPCHGSQFAPDGAVLNGPAITPLAVVERDSA
ncbi:FAD-dependent oxidoreductase [Phreatobacter sp.]|uniref:FAD-dependent oxidoreductase n=1 Tax=Phreatobacter sp. TaxID=1966341 RepID=UPI0025FBB797|nr:FAD-dependent oxidoreductase [Phreatobacter sp.]